MGWFLWGITFGWTMCAAYYYSQIKSEEASNGAVIIGLALGIVALIVSVSLGLSGGAIPHDIVPTVTPLLGR